MNNPINHPNNQSDIDQMIASFFNQDENETGQNAHPTSVPPNAVDNISVGASRINPELGAENSAAHNAGPGSKEKNTATQESNHEENLVIRNHNIFPRDGDSLIHEAMVETPCPTQVATTPEMNSTDAMPGALLAPLAVNPQPQIDFAASFHNLQQHSWNRLFPPVDTQPQIDFAFMMNNPLLLQQFFLSHGCIWQAPPAFEALAPIPTVTRMDVDEQSDDVGNNNQDMSESDGDVDDSESVGPETPKANATQESNRDWTLIQKGLPLCVFTKQEISTHTRLHNKYSMHGPITPIVYQPHVRRMELDFRIAGLSDADIKWFRETSIQASVIVVEDTPEQKEASTKKGVHLVSPGAGCTMKASFDSKNQEIELKDEITQIRMAKGLNTYKADCHFRFKVVFKARRNEKMEILFEMVSPSFKLRARTPQDKKKKKEEANDADDKKISKPKKTTKKAQKNKEKTANTKKNKSQKKKKQEKKQEDETDEE